MVVKFVCPAGAISSTYLRKFASSAVPTMGTGDVTVVLGAGEVKLPLGGVGSVTRARTARLVEPAIAPDVAVITASAPGPVGATPTAAPLGPMVTLELLLD